MTPGRNQRPLKKHVCSIDGGTYPDVVLRPCPRVDELLAVVLGPGLTQVRRPSARVNLFVNESPSRSIWPIVISMGIVDSCINEGQKRSQRGFSRLCTILSNDQGVRGSNANLLVRVHLSIQHTAWELESVARPSSLPCVGLEM